MAEHMSAAKAAKHAIRTRMNHDAILYFIAAMAGMAAIFVLYHLLRLAVSKRKWTSDQNSKEPSLPVAMGRKVRSFTIRKAPALPSRGHALFISLYVITNIILMFAHADYNNMPIMSNLASRTGWLAIVNMVLVVFLALKNTPLAFLTSWSYERLNILHQVSGYMTLIHVIIHTACYCSYFVQDGRPSRLLYPEEICGMVAGLSFFALAFSGAVIRPWWYELFYYMHISFWMTAIVMVGLHQPEFSKKIIFATIVAGGIWTLDRLVRMARIAMYSISNEVTIYPLPNGGTRVCLKKPPLGAKSGKHCFLWIPRIRSCETHPFTIAATEPVEFAINSYDGFTRDLHQYAVKHPGVTLKASVDGSYGTFPPAAESDKMVLVAGGSGATFTFGAALNALKIMSPEAEKSIIFIWVVKHYSQLTWFSQHIKTLEADKRVSIRLYITRPPTLEVVPLTPTEGASEKKHSETATITKDPEKELRLRSETHFSSDSEKGPQSDGDVPSPMDGMDTHIENVPIIYQRPEIQAIIRTEIDETPVNKRVLVMGCGPDSLMRAVRDTSADCIRTQGPAVEVHCEQFGW